LQLEWHHSGKLLLMSTDLLLMSTDLQLVSTALLQMSTDFMLMSNDFLLMSIALLLIQVYSVACLRRYTNVRRSAGFFRRLKLCKPR
jgi:hypothetical protein